MLIRPVRSYLCFRENLNYPTAARNHSGKSRIEVCKSYKKNTAGNTYLIQRFLRIGTGQRFLGHRSEDQSLHPYRPGRRLRHRRLFPIQPDRCAAAGNGNRHSLQIGMFGGHRVRRPLSLPHNRTMEPLPHSRRQCERLGQMVLRLRCGRRLRLPDHPPLEYIAHVQIPFPDSHVRTESDPDLPGRNFHILTEKHGDYRYSDLRFKCFGIAECTRTLPPEKNLQVQRRLQPQPRETPPKAK